MLVGPSKLVLLRYKAIIKVLTDMRWYSLSCCSSYVWTPAHILWQDYNNNALCGTFEKWMRATHPPFALKVLGGGPQSQRERYHATTCRRECPVLCWRVSQATSFWCDIKPLLKCLRTCGDYSWSCCSSYVWTPAHILWQDYNNNALCSTFEQTNI